MLFRIQAVIEGTVMHKPSVITRFVLVVAVLLPLVSCSAFDRLRALRVIKEAHTEYGRGDYEAAAELYEEVLANDPNLVDAYFYLANSYDQQFRPALRGEPENDHFLDMAIDNYILSAERQTGRPMQTLSLQYLVAAFGPDKSNEPAKSEPVLQTMITTDPENPENYFALSRLYEDSGLVAEAEEVLENVSTANPDDPDVHRQVAAFYNRNEQFDETIAELRRVSELEPENPEAFYTISTYYWEKAFRDFTIDEDQQMEYVLLGLDEANKALELNADYMEALTYKNILLRMQANLTDAGSDRDDLIAEADELRDRAEELQQLRASGVGVG